MAVYYGVGRDAHIVLEGDARLAEGTRVEVRPHPIDTSDWAALEGELIQRLRAEGLIEEAPAADGEEDVAFEPVVVQGEPLSEQIIRERSPSHGGRRSR